MSICENLSGGGRESHDLFITCISLENLFAAWDEFRRGKEKRRDIRAFAFRLEDNIFALHSDLESGNYRHGEYISFYIRDPKLRHIHKASVKDRLVHHAVHRIIEPLFDRAFIHDSYASRKGKGAHKAMDRLRKRAWQVSRNNTKTIWVVHCDIRKYFDSIDHKVLIGLLDGKINDSALLWLLKEIIGSFFCEPGKGLPLGNVTSQLFANIYLNELDQHTKRELRIKTYIRYMDDCIIVADQPELRRIVPLMASFLQNRLMLDLHPKKTIYAQWHSGVDFLGYVHFPHHCVVRTRTAQRMWRRVSEKQKALQSGDISLKEFRSSIMSYMGCLQHGSNFRHTQRFRAVYGREYQRYSTIRKHIS